MLYKLFPNTNEVCMILSSQLSNTIYDDAASTAVKILYDNSSLISELFEKGPTFWILFILLIGAIIGFFVGRYLEKKYYLDTVKMNKKATETIAIECEMMAENIKECRRECEKLRKENKLYKKGKK